MTSTHKTCWREAAGQLEAWNNSQGHLGIAYLSSISALCRANDQPWSLLLHALHVPRLLCRAVRIMLADADAMQDSTYEEMMAIILAASNLIRTAYVQHASQQHQAGSGSPLHHACSVLSGQILQSGLLQQLPVALSDVTAAVVAAGEQDVCGDSSCNQLVLLGLPLLQLCTDICLIWPGGILSCREAAPTTAAALRLALAVLSRSSPQLPSMLHWKAVNLIVQLTDPATVEAAMHASTPGLTATGDFLQAVVVVLVMQAHWLMQPAAASICSNRRRCHSSDDLATTIDDGGWNDKLEGYLDSFSGSSHADAGSSSAAEHLAVATSSTSGCGAATLSTCSSWPIPSRSSSGSSSSGGGSGSSGTVHISSSSSIVRTNSAGSCPDGRQHVIRHSSWLFRNVASYWAQQTSDTAAARDQDHQQQGRGVLCLSHARLLGSLGLQQHKLYELVEVVFSEGVDGGMSERKIELQLGLMAKLSQHMRAANQKVRSCQMTTRPHFDAQPTQQLYVPSMALSMAAHSPSNYGMVIAAAAAVREALGWWPLLMKQPQGQQASAAVEEAGTAGPGHVVEQAHTALPVQELLQLLVHTIQKVLQQPDAPSSSAASQTLTYTLAGAALTGNHSNGACASQQQATKAAALNALADAVSALSHACVECDTEGSLTAWQQDSQPLAAAFTAVLRDAAAAAQSRSSKKVDGSIDKLLVALLYAERFFFMDTAKCPPAVYGAAAGRADGEAGQLLALLLSTL